MSKYFEIAKLWVEKISGLMLELDQFQDGQERREIEKQITEESEKYFTYLLSLTVLLELGKLEYEYLKNQVELYTEIYCFSSLETQRKIKKILNSSLSELVIELRLQDGNQENLTSNELNMSLFEMAKKMIPLKIEQIVSDKKQFIFTLGLRDELHIRLTQSKAAPHAHWEKELTQEEKKEIQLLIWTLTEPYIDNSFVQVKSCRNYIDKVLKLEPLWSIQKNITNNKNNNNNDYAMNKQACIEHIYFLCVQAKQQKAEATQVNNNSYLSSFGELIFTPIQWISPRAKVILDEGLLIDLLITELNPLLLKEPVVKLSDMYPFLEKLSIVQQFSMQSEKYPIIFECMPEICSALSKCFLFEDHQLETMLSDMFVQFKTKCQNMGAQHEPFSIDKIQEWVKKCLLDCSVETLLGFSDALHHLLLDTQPRKSNSYFFT